MFYFESLFPYCLIINKSEDVYKLNLEPYNKFKNMFTQHSL